jgi:hypothetical protein
VLLPIPTALLLTIPTALLLPNPTALPIMILPRLSQWKNGQC